MSPRIGLDQSSLIQAATEIADAQGMEAVTLATLAKKLKIRPPSLYNHIEGLSGLRKKLAIHGLEQLNSHLSRAAIGRSGDEAVRSLSKAYVEFARRHPGLYEATLYAPDPKDADVHLVSKEIVDLVVQVLSYYSLEEETTLHVVRGLRSILHGFAALEQKGGFGLPLDLDVSLQLIIDTYLAGIHQLKKCIDPQKPTKSDESYIEV